MTPLPETTLDPIGIIAAVALLIFILSLLVIKKDAKNRQDMFSKSNTKSKPPLKTKKKRTSHNHSSHSTETDLSLYEASDGDSD